MHTSRQTDIHLLSLFQLLFMSNPPKTVLNVEIGQFNDVLQGSWHLIILTHLLQPVPKAGLPALSFVPPFPKLSILHVGSSSSNNSGRKSFTLGQTKNLRFEISHTCDLCNRVSVETKPRPIVLNYNIYLWLPLFSFPHLYYLKPLSKDPTSQSLQLQHQCPPRCILIPKVLTH